MSISSTVRSQLYGDLTEAIGADSADALMSALRFEPPGVTKGDLIELNSKIDRLKHERKIDLSQLETSIFKDIMFAIGILGFLILVMGLSVASAARGG